MFSLLEVGVYSLWESVLVFHKNNKWGTVYPFLRFFLFMEVELDDLPGVVFMKVEPDDVPGTAFVRETYAEVGVPVFLTPVLLVWLNRGCLPSAAGTSTGKNPCSIRA